MQQKLPENHQNSIKIQTLIIKQMQKQVHTIFIYIQDLSIHKIERNPDDIFRKKKTQTKKKESRPWGDREDPTRPCETISVVKNFGATKNEKMHLRFKVLKLFSI